MIVLTSARDGTIRAAISACECNRALRATEDIRSTLTSQGITATAVRSLGEDRFQWHGLDAKQAAIEGVIVVPQAGGSASLLDVRFSEVATALRDRVVASIRREPTANP